MTPEKFKTYLKELEHDFIELKVSILNYVKSGDIVLSSDDLSNFNDYVTRLYSGKPLDDNEAEDFIKIRDDIANQLAGISKTNQLDLVTPLMSLKSIIDDTNVSVENRLKALTESKKILNSYNINSASSTIEDYDKEFKKILSSARNQKISNKKLRNLSSLSYYKPVKPLRDLIPESIKEELENNPGQFSANELGRDILTAGLSSLGLGQVDQLFNLSGKANSLISKGFSTVKTNLFKPRDKFAETVESSTKLLSDDSKEQLKILSGIRDDLKETQTQQANTNSLFIKSIDKLTNSQKTQIKLTERSISENSKSADRDIKDKLKKGGTHSGLLGLVSKVLSGGGSGDGKGGIISSVVDYLTTNTIVKGATKVLGKIPGVNKIGGLLTKIPGVGGLIGKGLSVAGAAASGVGTGLISSGMSAVGLGGLDTALNISGKAGGLLSKIPLGGIGRFAGKALGVGGRLAGKLAIPLAAGMALYDGYKGFSGDKATELFGNDSIWNRVRSSGSSILSGLTAGLVSDKTTSKLFKADTWKTLGSKIGGWFGYGHNDSKADNPPPPPNSDSTDTTNEVLLNTSVDRLSQATNNSAQAISIASRAFNSSIKSPREEDEERQDLADKIAKSLSKIQFVSTTTDYGPRRIDEGSVSSDDAMVTTNGGLGGGGGGLVGSPFGGGGSNNSPISKNYGTSLGSLSSAYEGNVGTAGGDGGRAYGKYQFDYQQGGLQTFFKESPEYAKEFQGLQPGTPEFNRKWQEVAQRDPKGFEAAQDKAARAKWYDPAAAKASELGFKMDDRGIQEAIFSGSIQHGGINKILANTAATPGFASMTPEQQIDAYYNERQKYAVAELQKTGRSDAINGVIGRYSTEREDAKKFSQGIYGVPPVPGLQGPSNAVDLARSMMGKHEIYNNGELKKFLKNGGVGIDPAVTAWCAGFASSSLAQSGIKGAGNVASSYLNWGNGVDDKSTVSKGDVLVRANGLQPGQVGGHVGMATGNVRYDKNGQLQLEMISGNTSGGGSRNGVTVNTTWEPASRVSVRRATRDDYYDPTQYDRERAAAANGNSDNNPNSPGDANNTAQVTQDYQAQQPDASTTTPQAGIGSSQQQSTMAQPRTVTPPPQVIPVNPNNPPADISGGGIQQQASLDSRAYSSDNGSKRTDVDDIGISIFNMMMLG